MMIYRKMAVSYTHLDVYKRQVLNAIYFMKTVIRIFVPERRTDCEVITIGAEKTYTVTIVLFICLNIALGMLSQPIVKWIQSGLAMFG